MHLAPDHASAAAPAGYPETPPRGGLSPAHLNRALEAIEARLPRSILVAELAASIPMSPFHFARAFKASVGVPPHRYILLQRIERAKALLEHGSEPISAISGRVGFKTTSHFTSVFRQLCGLTPARYRASRRDAIAG